MEMILSLLKIDPIVFGKILMVLLIINVCLSAASKAFEEIANMTPSDSDNKAAGIVSKVAGYFKMVVDFLSANRPH